MRDKSKFLFFLIFGILLSIIFSLPYGTAFWLNNMSYVASNNITTTVTNIKNIPVLINGTGCLANNSNKECVWCLADVLSNLTFYKQADNITYRCVNESDNFELLQETSLGNGTVWTSEKAKALWQSAYTDFVFHFNGTAINSTGGTATTSGVTYTDTGVLDGGVVFDAGSDLINFGNVMSSDSASGYSIEFWINLTANPTSATLFQFPCSGIRYNSININSTRGIDIGFDTAPTCGSGDGVTTSAQLTLNKLHHIVVTYSPTNGVLYLDSKVKRTFTVATGTSTSKWTIGHVEQTGSINTATILEFRIYNKSLSQNEVTARYDAVINSTIGIFQTTSINTAPYITDVAISPSYPMSSDTLNCSAIYNDDEENTGDVQIDWYNGTELYSSTTKNGISNGEMISDILASTINTGEIWNCSINATDSEGLAGDLNLTSTTILGYDITSCREIRDSGNYYFTTDIEYTTTNYCIYIIGSDIELDCDNHYIGGASANIGFLVNGTSTEKFTNITIKNCRFGGWKRNIEFFHNENSTISNCSLGGYAPHPKIWLNMNKNTQIINNNFGGADGILIDAGENNTIANNIISGGSGTNAGIYFDVEGGEQPQNCRIINNTISSYPTAILLEGAKGNIFINNRVTPAKSTVSLVGYEGLHSQYNIFKGNSFGMIGITQSGYSHSHNLFYDGSASNVTIFWAKNNTFLNYTFVDEETVWRYGELIRKWYLATTIYLEGQVVIEDANVSAYNKTGNIVASALSSAEGKVILNLTDYINLAGAGDETGEITYYSNYTIETVKDDKSKEIEVNMSEGNKQVDIIFFYMPEIISLTLNSPLTQIISPNCSVIANDDDNDNMTINITFFINDIYENSVLKNASSNQLVSFSIPAQGLGNNVTCEAFANDGIANSDTQQVSALVSLVITTLNIPSDNAELFDGQTILLKATTNYATASCTFYRQKRGTSGWTTLGTNSTLGTEHTLSYTIPYEIGYHNFKASCDTIYDINSNIKISSGNTGNSITGSVIDLFVSIGSSWVAFAILIALAIIIAFVWYKYVRLV